MDVDTVYQWDEAKAAGNLAKHGVGFEAVFGFDWSSAIITSDSRSDYGEDRFEAVGFIDDRLFVLIFTLRGSAVRVISLRKANKRERNDYA